MPKVADSQTLDLIPTAEAALILGVHIATVTRRAAAGDLPVAMKLPGETGAYLFNRADIEAAAGDKASAA